jgi:hypothetical protein
MLSVKNLLFISNKASKILNSKHTSKFTHAINSLNVIKFHNDYLISQKIFFTNSFYSSFFFIIKTIIGIIKWFFKISENLILSLIFKKNINSLTSENDIVFVSFIRNEYFDPTAKDFVYGDILNSLKKNNIKYKILYLNLTATNSRKIINRHNNKNLFILENILSLKGEFTLLYWQFIELKNIFVNFFLKDTISFTFFIKVAISIFSNQTKINLRIYYQFDNFFSKQKSFLGVSTFEGYAWEKLFNYSLRKNNLESKCLAYQHSGILNNQQWLKKFKFNEFSPDHIFTCGKINRKKLIKLNKLFKYRVSVIGTSKNNILKKKNEIERPNKKKINCLVCPEGSIQETKIIFNYIFEVFKNVKNIRFILRTHPFINIRSFFDKYMRHETDIFSKNIILSKKKFEFDIQRSQLILFRGSYSVISGLLNSLIPIYYKNEKDFFNISPIEDYKYKIFFVKNSKEFINLINNKSFYKYFSYLKAKKYASNFFSPYNEKLFLNYINKIKVIRF